MSLFKTDYSNNEQQNYTALPQGEYEMVINKATENSTPNGAETFQIDLIVRNDLTKVEELAETNGKYANRHVFNDNWKRKATKQYDLESFQYILEAAQVPEGTEINSMDDLAKHITGKPVRVFVKKEFSEYRGEDENQVAPWNYRKSQYPALNHQFKEKDKPNNNTNLNDNDVLNIEDNIPF